tara:strand:- start:18 stop:164 length:147 start_codon:yes stop_codon:yes gene_type:complete
MFTLVRHCFFSYEAVNQLSWVERDVFISMRLKEAEEEKAAMEAARTTR